jgi:hypothetical protein
MALRIRLFLPFLTIATFAFARDGMWLPFLIRNNVPEMHAMGCELIDNELFASDSIGLNHAIVHFGSGCTGSFISGKGLIITNFHCSHRQIQDLSTLENNFLEKGFFALSIEEELPVKGLSVTIVVAMEEITSSILEGTDTLSDNYDRRKRIADNLKNVEKNWRREPYQQVAVKSFFNDNQYFIQTTETYNDIRLVAAPPDFIGKFGGDTDNWEWPRHTGDFAVFRVYASSLNQPAAFDSSNVAYKPKNFLPISLKGINEGEFTMVYGFPGTTQSYLTASAIKLIQNQSNPDKVAIRDIRLQEMQRAMVASAEDNFKYSAKAANVSNAWKKWEGEVKGLIRFNVIQKKAYGEKEFMAWIFADSARNVAYGNLLPQMDSLYHIFAPYQRVNDYYTEIIARGLEVNTMYQYFQLLKNPNASFDADAHRKRMVNSFKNQTPAVEKETFVRLMAKYAKALDPEFVPASLAQHEKKGDLEANLGNLYEKSILTNEKKLTSLKWVKKGEKYNPAIYSDPLFVLLNDIRIHYNNFGNQQYLVMKREIDELQKTYMKAILEQKSECIIYPDANSTLRISYGKAEGYLPRDAVKYHWQSTSEGILEKATTTTYDYAIPESYVSLLRSYRNAKYTLNNTLPTCFIASNHTTGGNSGSPVLNGRGELVGINFDRSWEGVMSDLYYEPTISRNISLDVRYVLFWLMFMVVPDTC